MAVLAHGRPLITTHSATPTPLQSGHNALLIPPNDELALVEAVRNLLVLTSLREGIGKGAKQVAAAFTWDKIAAQTADFFQTLIAP
jgi:glycosyltransferase involved in cell wall biosynthesis